MELLSPETTARAGTARAEGQPMAPAPSKRMLVLLLLPVAGYVAILGLSIWRRPGVVLAGADLVLLILALTYCFVGTYLACRRSIYLPRLLACLYAILILGGLLEAGMRLVRPPVENVPFPPTHTIYSPKAYLPGVTAPIEFNTNSLGLRGPEVRLDAVDVRILCVGGSTTECRDATDKQSWPWRIQDTVAERTGKAVFVGNSGKSGHIVLNHDYLLKNYPQAPRFEHVVVLCGINDMAAQLIMHNFEEHKATVESVTLYNPASRKREAYYRDLALVQTVKETLARFHQAPGIVLDREDLWVEGERKKRWEALQARPVNEVPRGDLEAALRTYRENLNQLINTCESQKQHLVLVTQPTIWRKDLPEDLERLTWMANRTAYTSGVLEQLMAAFNEVLIDVCRKRGVDYVDAASQLPKDTSVFFDDCHFNVSGNAKLGAILADYFTAKLK